MSMKYIYVTFIILCFLSGCQKTSTLKALENGTMSYVKAVELGKKIRFDEATCGESIICGNSAVEPSSIISLIGSPTNWSGKAVSVKGFINYHKNGTSLFMTTEHCVRQMSEYSIKIDTSAIPNLSDTLIKTQNCLEAYMEGIYSPNLDRAPIKGKLNVTDTPGSLALKYIVLWDVR